MILVGLQNPDDALHFRRIVVAEKGLGLGRSAVQYVKQFAFLENGSHRLWLNVKEGNQAAYSLYLSGTNWDRFIYLHVWVEAKQLKQE